MRINVIVQDKAWKKYIKNPEAFLEKKTKLLINNYKPFYKSNLFSTLVLTNSKMIKDLNKKFRKKNKSTDIISFPFYKKSELRRLLKSNKKVYIGDIVINLNKIKKKDFKKNFNILWVHGLLHLIGFTHSKDVEYYKMLRLEKKFLKLIS
mgnify:FL=1|tara:strand:+ start:941 stop:1390 length:450 start_codon:yes stop_codon:yes gene_type:complete